MSLGLRRGEIYRVRQPQHGDPTKSRCFAVVSRQDLLDSKANRVLCAPINTSGVGLSTEVQVGVDEGLKHDSVINCDQITRLEKNVLSDYVGALSLAKLKQLRTTLAVALDIEDDPDGDGPSDGRAGERHCLPR
jgi:mRNA interferase MazF